MVGPLFWSACVLAYTFLFNHQSYYGGYDTDWANVAKIIFFPTLVAWAGWAVWRYVIQRH